MLSLLPASVCLFLQTGLRLGFQWRKQTTSRFAKDTVHRPYSYNCNAVGEVTALDLDSVPNLSRVVCVWNPLSFLHQSACLRKQDWDWGFDGGSKKLADWPKATVHWRYSYHLQCSLLMQLEKSQILIRTLFQICLKQCVPALANKHKKREKKFEKKKIRKQECEKYATVIVGARNDSQKRAKTTRTTLHCRQR